MKNSRFLLLMLLLAVMGLTRYGHAPLQVILWGDASWAVFMLGGFYFGAWSLYLAFFALAVFVDAAAIGWGGVASACLSQGYVLLLPAYALLWQGGRVFAAHADRLLARSVFSASAFAAGVAVCAVFAAFVVSNLGVYLFSPVWRDAGAAAYALRVAQYFPHFLAVTSGYLAAAAGLHLAARGLAERYRTRALWR